MEDKFQSLCKLTNKDREEVYQFAMQRSEDILKGTSYKDAGVDIDAGNNLVKHFKKLANKANQTNVLSGIGGFSGICNIPKGFNDPVLVASTDGVGTKIKVASKLHNFSGLGIDLVAMCVNDLLTTGAMPLFFMDYIAMGRLNEDIIHKIVSSVAEGCRRSNCALLGGETAEMPGVYKDNDFDLAGFAVGIKEKNLKLDGNRIKLGNVVIGIPSSGFHSNGFSLIRNFSDSFHFNFLTPTRIYVKEITKIFKLKIEIRGIVHITGGGLIDNPPRILSDHLAYKFFCNWKIPYFMESFIEFNKIELKEARRVFNIGLGMLIIVSKESSQVVLDTIEDSLIVGEIVERKDKQVIFEVKKNDR